MLEGLEEGQARLIERFFRLLTSVVIRGILATISTTCYVLHCISSFDVVTGHVCSDTPMNNSRPSTASLSFKAQIVDPVKRVQSTGLDEERQSLS